MPLGHTWQVFGTKQVPKALGQEAVFCAFLPFMTSAAKVDSPPNAPAPGSAKLESVLFTSDCFTPPLIYMPAAATRFMFDPLGSHFQRTKL